jgi:hypothetical protein
MNAAALVAVALVLSASNSFSSTQAQVCVQQGAQVM